MAIARPNGQPQDVVRHLTTRCGVPIEVAERLVPNREGVEDSPRTALTPDALDRYNTLVRREFAEDAVLRACLLLLPLTGLRIAEICGLRTEDVGRDGDKVSWTFIGKGDKKRTVPLWRKARRVFDPYMASERPRSRYVFPNVSRAGHLRPATVQEACRHLASLDLSLKHLTPHVLRHTFATMALLNCHDIKRTQEILGHGKKNTVKIPVVMLRYLHPDVERSTPNSPRTLAVRTNPGQTVDMAARPFAAESAKRTRKKAKENPMRDDDWYWKAIYSNVPPGPSRAHPVAQRNPQGEIHYTSKGQPYVYMNGRPRFIKKSEAKHARKNGWAQVIEPFSVSEEKLGGRQPIARRNPKKKASAKKNNHRVWEQIIDPFSVTEARTYGRQPIGRRNPSEDKQPLLSKSTVPWSKFSKDEIQMILQEALLHGDLVLAEKAKSALNRRSSKSRRNPDIWKQVIEPFSVSEERIGGLQPIARRNKKKKSKAKKNGVVRVYKVK